MKNKGISPLVAWVILIGFTITAGLLVTKWAIDEFSNVEFPTDKESYCDDIQIDIDEICILASPDNDKIRINMSNNGLFTIKRLNIGRSTTIFSKEWCTLLSFGLKPNDDDFTVFKAGSSNSEYSSIRQTDCNLDLSGGEFFDINHNLTLLEIVPIIEIEDESFHCIQKGIILNSSNELNKICS